GIDYPTAPVLQHPDPTKPFAVEVNALYAGVGVVLSQYSATNLKLKHVAFFSMKLSPAKTNYRVRERVLLAIKLAFEKWSYWLERAQHLFVVMTDHKNLKFNFTITYWPVSKNIKTDAPSRQSDPEAIPTNQEFILPSSFSLGAIGWDLNWVISQAKAHPGCPPN
ncbi:hypothetical protein P4O66_009391, partial [Electrophorus voltai]